MVVSNFYINNVLVPPPFDWAAAEIELNFDRDRTNVREHVTFNNLDFVRENADFLENYLADGVGTGVGILEAPALRWEIVRGGVTEKLLDGYIDTASDGEFSKIIASFPVKERKNIDWLNDVADRFTFEYLYNNGGISNNDFVFVPYILNSIPDYESAAVATLTVVFVGNALKDAIKELAKSASAMGSYFYYTAILEFILELIYVIALVITLLKLIKDIIMFLIQPVKYHACMSAKKLMEAGCNELGMTFKSDIFDAGPYTDLHIIPQKYSNLPDTTNPNIFGWTIPDKTKQNGYYLGTFGQLIRDLKETFFLKVVIKENPANGNTELYLVRDDTNLSTPQYQLKDIRNFKRKTNAADFKANFDIKFETDTTDKNTSQPYSGVGYQQILSPIRVTNQDLILMKGLERINIPFARAATKTELTVPEKIVDAFLNVFGALLNGIISVVNGIISVLNAITSAINNIINALGVIGINISFQIQPIPSIQFSQIGNLIDNRIGMMQIQYDHFDIAKLVLLDVKSLPKNTKIQALNGTYLSAEYIFKAFHFLKSWLPSTTRPTGNQYIHKTYENVSFTFTDYQKVRDSNIIFDYYGNEPEIVSLKWNPYKLVANFEVRFPTLLTDNLQLTELIPNGQ